MKAFNESHVAACLPELTYPDKSPLTWKRKINFKLGSIYAQYTTYQIHAQRLRALSCPQDEEYHNSNRWSSMNTLLSKRKDLVGVRGDTERTPLSMIRLTADV